MVIFSELKMVFFPVYCVAYLRDLTFIICQKGLIENPTIKKKKKYMFKSIFLYFNILQQYEM